MSSLITPSFRSLITDRRSAVSGGHFRAFIRRFQADMALPAMIVVNAELFDMGGMRPVFAGDVVKKRQGRHDRVLPFTKRGHPPRSPNRPLLF